MIINLNTQSEMFFFVDSTIHLNLENPQHIVDIKTLSPEVITKLKLGVLKNKISVSEPFPEETNFIKEEVVPLKDLSTLKKELAEKANKLKALNAKADKYLKFSLTRLFKLLKEEDSKFIQILLDKEQKGFARETYLKLFKEALGSNLNPLAEELEPGNDMIEEFLEFEESTETKNVTVELKKGA